MISNLLKSDSMERALLVTSPTEGTRQIGENLGTVFAPSQTRQEGVNGNSPSLQTKGREALVIPLPISMHTGQIIMVTKMLTTSDLRFYEFDNGAPVESWRSGPRGST